MKFIKYGAVMIVVYLVVSSKFTAQDATAGASGLSNVIKAFQGRG